MKLYIEQIPEGFSFEDYPEDTEFIPDDAPMERNPQTFQSIPRENRPPVFPKDM